MTFWFLLNTALQNIAGINCQHKTLRTCSDAKLRVRPPTGGDAKALKRIAAGVEVSEWVTTAEDCPVSLDKMELATLQLSSLPPNTPTEKIKQRFPNLF